MGKIDDMRRAREQQFADAEARVAKAARAAPAVVDRAPAVEPPRIEAPRSSATEAEPAQPSRPTRPSKSGAATGEQGKCPDCGKTKPLSNGVLASHQKGFGKACTGSRKPPA